MRTNYISRFVLGVLAALVTPAFAGESTIDQRSSAVPRFTMEQAILTALQQNPDILRARQEIERTRGVYIQLRAAALPQAQASGVFQDIDPHLGTVSSSGSGFSATERSYHVDLLVNQAIFSGGRIPSQISSAGFLQDSAYFAF